MAFIKMIVKIRQPLLFENPALFIRMHIIELLVFVVCNIDFLRIISRPHLVGTMLKVPTVMDLIT